MIAEPHDCIAYDRGLHLRGTQLWIDSERKRGLCLITTLGQRLPPVHARACAPQILAEQLLRCGYKGVLLPAQTEQWLGIGGKQVQFLESGGVLILNGTEKLLIVGAPRREPASWPKADHVVAVLPAIGIRGSSMARVEQGLRLFLAQAERDQVRAHVQVDHLEVGALLAQTLALRPLGLLRHLAPALKAGPTIALPGTRGVASAARVCHVETGIGGHDLPAAATFRLGWFADLAALRHLIRNTGAQRLTAIGVAAPQRRRTEDALRVPIQFTGPALQLTLSPGVTQRDCRDNT